MNIKIEDNIIRESIKEVRIKDAVEKITSQIKENNEIDDSGKETLKAILSMASKNDLGRIEIQSDNSQILERVGIILSPENPRLAIIKRFHDEEGRGEEGIVEMPIDGILDYVTKPNISIKNVVETALRAGIEDSIKPVEIDRGEKTNDEK